MKIEIKPPTPRADLLRDLQPGDTFMLDGPHEYADLYLRTGIITQDRITVINLRDGAMSMFKWDTEVKEIKTKVVRA